MFFSSTCFLKNFLRKTRPKLVDKENGFKKVFISFYIADALYWIKFFFYNILLFFIGIYICTTHNIMFSGLKPKPETKIGDKKNNEQLPTANSISD